MLSTQLHRNYKNSILYFSRLSTKLCLWKSKPWYFNLKQTCKNWHQPKETRAGTADWLIQKDTQDMATSKMDGMYDWMM